MGWIAVGVVVIVLVVFGVVLATRSPSTPTSSTGDAAGRNPAAAAASVTGPLASIPKSVFDSVGTAGGPASLTVTAKQPKLLSSGKPEFVYLGAEYCPFCAMDRWAMVAALNRFGSFTGLKQITSSSTDSAYQSIPTLSFYGAKYTSPYLVFSPYESEDIAGQPLMNIPTDKQALYSTYDGSNSGTGTKFDGGNAGIPFVDIANQYVSAGAPGTYSPVAAALQHNGLTYTQIAQAVANPSSAVGTAMGAKYLVAEANYLSAGICNVNGNKPASVCSSAGVLAAKKVLAAAPKVS